CMISVGGGGDASLSGSAEKFYGEMKSGGDLSASDFMVQAAKLNLTGGSDARVHVEQELKVDASGGSQVYVSGDPHIDANLSGGSKVHKK
ncbi:GIN domain-containing protein, partial [Bacteroidota bacterium]